MFKYIILFLLLLCISLFYCSCSCEQMLLIHKKHIMKKQQMQVLCSLCKENNKEEIKELYKQCRITRLFNGSCRWYAASAVCGCCARRGSYEDCI